jgi:alkylation response protein AidB-like acyl-CoA dehydrogenase
MAQHMRHVAEDAQLTALRSEVRRFLQRERESGSFVPEPNSWITGWDPTFSKRLAQRGWIGMTIPPEYGGSGATLVERLVVVEEVVAAGAPVAAHWVSDRQIVPSLLKYGTEFQRRLILPGIASGDIYFAIGMSEPDSGSDLASVHTKAERVEGGWTMRGSKIWTSGAHESHYFIVLARTAPLVTDHRHEGLSQFVVALDSPGIDIRPVLSMDGTHHFNEVFFDDVFIPDEMVFGEIGDGWIQVTSELGFERSGPERFLSTMPVLEEMASVSRAGTIDHPSLGLYFARIVTLHQMSLSVNAALLGNGASDAEAAIVKVLGTSLEGDIVETAASVGYPTDANDDRLRLVTERGLFTRPGYTIRGGTNEILRGVIARALGLR